MFLLVGFAFIAGVVTILSPCILPVLPLVLSGSVTGNKRRPWGVVIGFIASFTFFTLFLSSLVKFLGIPADWLRWLAVAVIAGFGLALVLPQWQLLVEKLFARLANLAPKTARSGFGGGILIGLSLGLVWTPCVGPILAAIISLAFAGTVSGSAVIITLAYATGTAIPLLAIVMGGRALLERNRWLVRNSAVIQRGFGILMMVTAVAILLNWDRQFQTWVLNKFPAYGAGLTLIEDNPAVNARLGNLSTGGSAPLRILGPAPELILGGQWFNSPPLKLADLKGKVVLIDFWTYTCINCIRSLPYVKSWSEKYADSGLVVIGVHTPEFEFEKNPDNVAKAIADFGIKYPVMQDNAYATWNAYSNNYWPAEYFIDSTGKLRHTHFGEGDYDESEAMIQKLLTEAGLLKEEMLIANPVYQVTARTPELYLGSLRYQPGWFALEGDWRQSEEYNSPQPGASLTLNFEAKDVYLVMRSNQAQAGLVKVFLDGQLLTEISVLEDKLYQLVKLDSPGKHILKLEFPSDRVDLFAFTFG
ncbi:MAG: cytochrome c biogenesis protein CcdA [bacterium]|nr:cytochrome c biogenesis protein CcdA [bacterium]